MTESFEQPTTLHPILQTALASLDLTVESELTYYRQQQAQLALLPEGEDASSVPAIEAEVEQTSGEQFVAVAPPRSDATQDEQGAEEEIASPPDDYTMADTDALPDAALVPVTDPQVQEAALVTTGDAQLLEVEPAGMIEIDTPPDAELDSETAEALNTQPPPPADFPKSYENYLDPSIEDYLESSEALLRHLEDSKTEPEPKVKPKKNLGLSGLLLMILAVLGLGTALFWGLSQQLRPSGKPPIPTPSSLPPSPSLQPTGSPLPSGTLPLPPGTVPSGTPFPKPTASSVPLKPPSPIPSTSVSPSPKQTNSPTTP